MFLLFGLPLVYSVEEAWAEFEVQKSFQQNRYPVQWIEARKKFYQDRGFRTEWSREMEVSEGTNTSPRRTGTNASFVGAAMALLATFEEVGVLPPEGTSQADQVIHAIIQLQSALIKSSSPELKQFISDALQRRHAEGWEDIYRGISQNGLSTDVLESLVTYPGQPSFGDRPQVLQALQQFNVTQADWRLVETIFRRAKDAYAEKGLSIHNIFAAKRKKMP